MRAIDAPSWAARAKSAERIAALYCRPGLDPATRRVAEEAFRVLRYDSEAVVRRLAAAEAEWLAVSEEIERASVA